MDRPTGPVGPLVLVGHARDIVTAEDETSLTAEASVRVVVDFFADRLVTSVETHPHVQAVSDLIGLRAGSGFRDRIPDDGALVSLLLDEVPVATLISRAALSDDGASDPGSRSLLPQIGVCAGWVDGGRLATSVRQHGRLPEFVRPAAPELLIDDDPDAWHPIGPLSPGSMRRMRRVDITPRDGDFVLDSMFRDSLMHPTEGHVVVHEYSVCAVIDGPQRLVRELTAVPRVLPAPECPVAAESAQRVVGTPLRSLRALVRREMTGTTTCTHLNDHLRFLGAAEDLMGTI